MAAGSGGGGGGHFPFGIDPTTERPYGSPASGVKWANEHGRALTEYLNPDVEKIANFAESQKQQYYTKMKGRATIAQFEVMAEKLSEKIQKLVQEGREAEVNPEEVDFVYQTSLQTTVTSKEGARILRYLEEQGILAGNGLGTPNDVIMNIFLGAYTPAQKEQLVMVFNHTKSVLAQQLATMFSRHGGAAAGAGRGGRRKRRTSLKTKKRRSSRRRA